MPTFEEIKKALRVLEVIQEGGTLRINADPNLGELEVTDICISERHGAIGINVSIDITRLLDSGKEKQRRKDGRR
jgi:hypothetical protein